MEDIIIDTTKQKPLLDIFNQCRKESLDILNDLITQKTIRGASGQIVEVQIQVDNPDLEGIIKKTYKDIVNKHNNKWDKRFMGEINDVYAVFMGEFITLVKDDLFNPANQEELCVELKRKGKNQIYNSLLRNKNEVKPPCYNAQEKDKNDEQVEFDPSDKQAYDKWLSDKYGSQESGYIGIFRDLLKINYNEFCETLPTDAEFQKSLIRLFQKPYSMTFENESFILKPLNEIALLLQCDGYNKQTVDVQIIRGMNTLFERLMKCAVGYCEVSRKEYKKVKSYDVKSIHRKLSDKSEKDIYKGCKYGITCNEYYKAYNNLTMRVDDVSQHLRGLGFTPNKEKILDLALFEYDKVDYWNFCKGNNGLFRLDYYDHIDKGMYKLKRTKSIMFTTLPECYIIGNCVIYADKDNKRLIYLQKESRLVAITKRDNKYKGCKFIGNL